MLQRQRKPRGGDRELSMFLLNTLHVLSPLRGLLLFCNLIPGVSPPSVVFRAFGAYLADSNNRINKLVNNTLSMSLSPLLSLSLLHYRRFFAALKCRRTSLPSVLFLFFETLGKAPRTGIRQKHRWKGASSHTPQSIVSHSTEHQLTLHGASAYAPRSIGLRSTEHRPTLHGASAHTPRSIGRCPKRHV